MLCNYILFDYFFKERNVFARRARLPVTPGFLAAASSFFSGMSLPFLTPRVFLNAPFLDELIAF